MFIEKTEVLYQNKCGIIDFICEKYVVIKFPPASSKFNSPKILVFNEDFNKIKSLKDSEK